MMPYERLGAWRLSDDLAREVYQMTASWPRAELYGMTAQVRRSALSAAANLAEGSAKRGPREFVRFVDISLGSLSELSYLLRFAHKIGYLSSTDLDRIEGLRNRARQMTWRLLRALRARS